MALLSRITNMRPEPASAQKHQVSSPSTQQRDLTCQVSVAELCKEGEITASIDPALFPPATTLESSTPSAEDLSDDFQVEKFNIRDLDALMDLSRARLSALCQHYGVPLTTRSNLELARQIYAAPSCPPLFSA